MIKKPVLVLQPRRLGDLILTFPLLRLLQRRFPGHPLWVMAQKCFYEPLLPFAPHVAFLPPAGLLELGARPYAAVINLGGSSEAAQFTGNCEADLKLGPVSQDGRLRINGYWQLYREGLIQNNRHNIFHWADLFRLDIQNPLPAPASAPRPANSGRVGLFVGASEAAKRPGAEFWAELSRRLAAMGFKPVLLGGPGDVAMGMAVMAKGAKAANFCGKTSISQLAGLLKSLDLLVTPDTGPMHLADLLGVPVLNLSMGNVHAAETGPVSPGQHVLRANMSCVGCWQCSRKSLYCRAAFHPLHVARLVAALALNDDPPASHPGLELLTTGRDELGLCQLSGPVRARTYLENFWQAAFLAFNDASHGQRLQTAANALLAACPALAARMRATFGKMLASIATGNRLGQPLPAGFWLSQPLHSRLFAGNIQITLENGGASAFGDVLSRLDRVQEVLSGAD